MFDDYKIREFQPSRDIKKTYILRLLNTVGTVDDYMTKIYKYQSLKLIEYRFNNNGVLVGYTFSTDLEVICSSWLALVKPKVDFDNNLKISNKDIFDNDELRISLHTQNSKTNIGYILVPFKEKI